MVDAGGGKGGDDSECWHKVAPLHFPQCTQMETFKTSPPVRTQRQLDDEGGSRQPTYSVAHQCHLLAKSEQSPTLFTKEEGRQVSPVMHPPALSCHRQATNPALHHLLGPEGQALFRKPSSLTFSVGVTEHSTTLTGALLD